MALGLLIVAAVVFVLSYLWFQVGDNDLKVDAVKRFLLGIFFFTIMLFVGTIFLAYLAIVFLADITFQFLTGREGFSPGGTAVRLWAWKDNNIRYLTVGEGEFQWIP